MGDNVTYEHAGANLGGQNLMTCGRCSALVQAASQAAHSRWHADLLRTFAEVAESVGEQPPLFRIRTADLA